MRWPSLLTMASYRDIMSVFGHILYCSHVLQQQRSSIHVCLWQPSILCQCIAATKVLHLCLSLTTISFVPMYCCNKGPAFMSVFGHLLYCSHVLQQQRSSIYVCLWPPSLLCLCIAATKVLHLCLSLAIFSIVSMYCSNKGPAFMSFFGHLLYCSPGFVLT